MIIRSHFVPERELSKVFFTDVEEAVRYVWLVFDDLPADGVAVFEEKLRRVLPGGSRWYGGVFQKIVVSEEKEEYATQFKVWWNETAQNHKDSWVEVLVDFGEVNEEVCMDGRKTVFSIDSLVASIHICNGKDVVKAGSTGFTYEYNLAGAFSAQVNIDDAGLDCICVFGERLIDIGDIDNALFCGLAVGSYIVYMEENA